MGIKNNKHLLSAMLCLGMTGASLGAMGAPVFYSESVDGDLNWNEFTVDEGLNVISGSTTYRPAQNIWDFDSFTIVVPTGMQLISVEYEWEVTDRVDPTGPSFGTGMDINDGDAGSWDVDVSSGGGLQNVLVSELPFGPGSYEFGHWLWYTGGDDSVVGGDWLYYVIMEVTPVPLPAAVWLFASSLLGLGFVGRRWSRGT